MHEEISKIERRARHLHKGAPWTDEYAYDLTNNWLLRLRPTSCSQATEMVLTYKVADVVLVSFRLGSLALQGWYESKANFLLLLSSELQLLQLPSH